MLISFTKDINEQIISLEKENWITLRAKLSNFIQFHSKAKQLSDHLEFEIKVKIKLSYLKKNP